jgi:hypothetical protein
MLVTEPTKCAKNEFMTVKSVVCHAKPTPKPPVLHGTNSFHCINKKKKGGSNIYRSTIVSHQKANTYL